MEPIIQYFVSPELLWSICSGRLRDLMTSPLHIHQSSTWETSSITIIKQEEEEECIDICDVEPTKSFLSDEEENKAYEVLNNAVYTTDQKDIVQVHKGAMTEDISDCVDLLITNLPYNTRRYTKSNSFNHDRQNWLTWNS